MVKKHLKEKVYKDFLNQMLECGMWNAKVFVSNCCIKFLKMTIYILTRKKTQGAPMSI